MGASSMPPVEPGQSNQPLREPLQESPPPAPPAERAFYNRQRELAQLEAAWLSRGAQFVTLWGRRRVGKSTLLARFAQGKRALYLYGTRLPERDILAALSLQAADLFDDAYLRAAPFPSWSAALAYLASRSRSERLLVVLDEFSYLCDASPGLDTLVQRWWDEVRDQSDLVLVVASSGFSFMEGLTGARGPLHGRRSGQLDVHPFDYLDASRFFPELGPSDRVRAYACFGGLPAYLRHWQPGLGLAENVQQAILSPGRFLFGEGEELLRTEFHQEALYAAILRAIAGGQERPSDIARAVGRGSAAEIFDHLRRLQELRFVRREVPVTEWERTRSQRVLYRLADPYLRFWYRYVLPYQSFLQLERSAWVWRREVAPTLDEFVARTCWEAVCHQHLWRKLALDQLPVAFSQLGRWWDNRAEIDMVGLWNRRVVLVGECKWTNEPMDVGDLDALRRSAYQLSTDEPALWVLASRSGFSPALRDRAAREPLLLLEPADLYADDTRTIGPT